MEKQYDTWNASTDDMKSPIIPVLENEDFQELFETYRAVEEVYNQSLTAMGLRHQPSVPVCSNTNISLSNVQSVSTR
jgi:hypothetical protein